MDQESIEALLESDNVIVNYNEAKYTPKETLINYAIGASVGLVCVGVVLGVGKTIDAVGNALYNRHKRKAAKKLEEETVTEEKSEED